MNKIKVNATFSRDVYIDPKGAIESIKNALGFADDRDTVLRVKDGQLMRGEDISYHGTPRYEYKTISNNPKWVELFNSIKCIEDYLNNPTSPEWDKIIDIYDEEDYDNTPVMGM